MTTLKNIKIPENIWLGVTVENKKSGLPRINKLRDLKASVLFLSVEPLLEDLGKINLKNIDWVIVGGESGHKAREIKQDWIDYIHNKCQTQNIPFFFKQWGKKHFNVNFNDPTMFKGHKQYAKGGCELNGQIIKEMPRPAYKTKAN